MTAVFSPLQETIMHIHRFTLTSIALALSLSFALPTLAEDAGVQARPSASPSANNPRADTSSADHKQAARDSKFVKEALMGGMFEVQAGQLALRNGSAPEVHTLAQHIVDDHTRAGEKLRAIAQQKGMTNLPDQLDADHQKELDRLQKLSGAEFDRKYAAMMISDHKKDIKAFEHEAAHGSDPQVKQLAADTTPTLKGHLSMAEAAKQVASGSRTTGATQSSQNNGAATRSN
jgi:putative membrane protein